MCYEHSDDYYVISEGKKLHPRLENRRYRPFEEEFPIIYHQCLLKLKELIINI